MRSTIYGNKRTKVAHRRGKRGDACRARTLIPRNIVNLVDWIDARNQGYKACKRCRPDT